MQPKPDGLVVVAQIGKSVGLKGEHKLHIKCDFPEQFKKGAVFYLEDGTTLKLKSYNSKKQLAVFEDYEDINLSKKFVNQFLYTTIEQTRQNCNLENGEYFWFDIVGMSIVENGETLGVVSSIEDISGVSYFLVDSHESLVQDGLPKSFLIPYIDRYVIKIDIDSNQISTNGAKDILKAS